jgi:adenosylhomocysteine nucleosidase
MKNRAIGIMAAMPEEIAHLKLEIKSVKTIQAGMRQFHLGRLEGKEVVLVFSRWGKVAAATTASFLISHFKVSEIFFTGVAGAVDPSLRIGDLVIGTDLFQHDMDARPLFERHEIPLIGKSRFPTEPSINEILGRAVENFLATTDHHRATELKKKLRMNDLPRVFRGTIASGDQFFSDSAKLAELRSRVPETLCVEMEGASVAQVCHEYGIPFSILRLISDTADEGAISDFPLFLKEFGSPLACEITKKYLSLR